MSLQTSSARGRDSLKKKKTEENYGQNGNNDPGPGPQDGWETIKGL